MSRLKISVLSVFFLVFLFLGGRSNLNGAKLWAPECFGLSKVDDYLYVEEGASEEIIEKLRGDIKKAYALIQAAYGSVESRPVINACVTEKCYKSFGGMGSKAKIYGNRILLSPRGQDWHFIAHEWSHNEMWARLSFSAWCRLPQWFDEAVAVVVSQAPDHSEEHWNFLVQTGAGHPAREELLSYKTLRQWLDAVRRFGATHNRERKARGEPEIHPVYAAAGHELRPWLRKAGPAGLLDVINRLNGGEQFDDMYRKP